MRIRKKRFLRIGLCFAVVLGCDDNSNQINTGAKILIVEVNDFSELKVEKKLILFEELDDILQEEFSTKTIDTIHYYSGKRKLKLDDQVSKALRFFAQKNNIAFKVFQSTGRAIDSSGDSSDPGEVNAPSNL